MILGTLYNVRLDNEDDCSMKIFERPVNRLNNCNISNFTCDDVTMKIYAKNSLIRSEKNRLFA